MPRDEVPIFFTEENGAQLMAMHGEGRACMTRALLARARQLSFTFDGPTQAP